MMAKVLPDASIVRCKACDGSGVVPRTYETELSRLRAENVRMNAKNNKLICDNGRLRAEKAELVEIIRHVVEHDPNRPGLHGEPIEILRSAVAMPKRWLADHANETETEPYEPPPYDWGKDKIPE